MTNILPKDDQTLMIVNCSKNWEQIESNQIYSCPVENSLRPCRYFGIYYNLKVQRVANIEAVVEVHPDGNTNARWIGAGGREADYRQKALDYFNNLTPKPSTPLQVFILGVLQATSFKKGTKGGTQTSKQYLNMSSLGVSSAGYLAPQLYDRKWTDFEKVGGSRPGADKDI